MRVDFYHLDDDGFAAWLKRIQIGDDRHAAEPWAFTAEDRGRLEAAVAAWDEILGRIPLLEARRGEARQTRDEAAVDFRAAVRSARAWAKGVFPAGDERPGEYGLGRMPLRNLNKMLTFGHAVIQANTQEPPLEPTLPERLLTQVQVTFAALDASIMAYQAAVVDRKHATHARRELRKEIEALVRYLRQHLYTYIAPGDPILLDYAFVQ